MRLLLRWLLVLLLTPASLAGAQSQPHQLVVVESGQPRGQIVVPQITPGPIMQGASCLQEYIAKATGACLPVVEAQGLPDSSTGVQILLKTLASEAHSAPRDLLADDGFAVSITADGKITIAGRTENGIEFGCYDFLERFLGVRWLLPGPMGDYVPQQPDLLVPVTSYEERPAFAPRMLSGLYTPPVQTWGRRNRMSRDMAFHHNLYQLFPPAKYRETHPEFYPLVHGRRTLPKDNDRRINPCFSAPGLAQEAIKNILQYFQEHPEVTSYSLGINDGHLRCQCDKCLAQVPARKNSQGYDNYSEIYYRWANEVARGVNQVFPDKRFGCLAYMEVADPPQGFALAPSIVPFRTFDRHIWADPERAALDQAVTVAWEAKATDTGWYDYMYGWPYMLPRLYFDLMAHYLRFARAHGVKAIIAEAYPNWGEGPKLYIAMRLRWNPDAAPETILEEWCRLAVGPQAAPFLMRYFEHWQKFWTSQELVGSSWFRKAKTYLLFSDPEYLSMIGFADLELSSQWLHQALQSTQTEDQRARAAFILRTFEYYQTAATSYLGLVRGFRQPGRDRGYYKAQHKKMEVLRKEWADDPVLRPLLKEKAPVWDD